MSPIFRYQTKDFNGTTRDGEIEALDETDATEKLRKQGLAVIFIEMIEEKKSEILKEVKLNMPSEEKQHKSTKKCPYCAEEIQAEAVFCKHCKKELVFSSVNKGEIIFEGKASWKGYRATVLTWIIASIMTFGLMLPIAILVFVFLAIKLKTQEFKITNQTIDTLSGLLVKKHNTMDVWRIKDIQLKQGIFDRKFGTGTILVASIDKSDNLLKMQGLPNAKNIYNKLKDTSFQQRVERKVTSIELS